MMGRENGRFPKHTVTLLDGLAVASVEAERAPKPDCSKANDAETSCVFTADLGKSGEDDPRSTPSARSSMNFLGQNKAQRDSAFRPVDRPASMWIGSVST